MTRSLDELLRTSGLVLPSMRMTEGSLAPEARPTAYVQAGHMFTSPTGHDVTTILGPCVAVCMWDPTTGIGGLNHYMLPSATGPSGNSLRCGSYAIPHLIESLIELGASKRRLDVKLFGGATVLKEFQNGATSLGQRNIDIARQLLLEARIAISFEDVGGRTARKIVFRTDDGMATVRNL